ncbi:MAG: carbohydrate-binding protein [Salinivirgaceae bacterium]|jgi:endo-1,3(4)-beta-glucanase|nr:carbohydrate-binding protein [Salinivirgaceae bacterium]
MKNDLTKLQNAKKLFTAAFLILIFAYSSIAQVVSVGSGSYTTTFPGTDEAGRNSYPSGTPYLSGVAATKPVPTNDWWSNLIKEAHGGQAFNYPLSYKSVSNGLVINYTMPAGGGTSDYRQPMSDVQGIVMGVSNMNTTQSTASDHSDWTATINWNDGSHDFSALMGHGMPFTYFTKGNGDVASVKIGFNLAGAYVSGNKIILENNYGGASYIVYGPAGSSWSLSGDTFTSTLNGKNYWSMVMVPSSMTVAAAISYFETYAFAFPTQTQVSWNYNESNSIVTTTYSITPDIKEGSGSNVFWGILPHHWGNLASTSAQPSSISYNTVRGELKMMISNTFSTDLRFSGILPTLPNLGKYSDSFNPAEVHTMIDQMKADGLPTWTDSYNEGQSMNRLVQTARVADQMGNTDARDQLLATVKERLEDWLTVESGEVAFMFYYNSDWKALIGYPAGHRQDNNLNDHHFHWGYFIHAAAAIEQFYPGWASQWGDMIYMLIRDAANPSRSDSMFPFLRNYSPYAGHSWANGFATEPFGNDQESTSESMQFNSALIHWGTITGNDEIRDLGIYLYATEHSSVNEYWFDQNDRTFQPTYQYEMVARIWGAGYDNGTWWTSDVAASYGIQLYPIHGGSLYLGHNTEYVQEVWNGMTKNTDVLNNISNDNLWYDTYWKYLSFLDADEALTLYNNYKNRNIKMGISSAQTYQWLHTMVALGQVAEEITADYPIAAVFNKDGVKTYAAHNYGSTQITVHFSDGYNLTVPARSRATSRDVVASVILQAASVELPSGGSTVLSANVTGSVSRIDFYKDGVLIGTDNSAPYSINTGSLAVGFPGFYAKANVGAGFNLSNVVAVQVGSQLPYLGTPFAIPGTIEAGNYDAFEGGAGQGIAYYDNTTWNEGDYRTSEAVDAASDASEGATVGWIEAGEWLEYTINASQAGKYKAALRYASGSSTGGGPFYFSVNGTKVSVAESVITTGDWGAWLSKEVNNVVLPAGESVLRISFTGGGLNVGKMTFIYDGPTNNNPPVANAGADQVLVAGTTSTSLNASSSTDPDGDNLSYDWSQSSGPNTAGFNSKSVANPSLTNLVAGTYIFNVSVSDGEFTNSDQVTVTVEASVNNAPIAKAGDDQVLPAGTTASSLVGSSSSDPDGDVLTFSWNQLSGPNSAVFSSETIANPDLSKLTAGDYTFELTVDDGELSNSDQVVLTVESDGNVAVIPGIIQAEEWTDMLGVQTEPTTDIGGGINVGWIDAGDWMEYEVNVTTAGTYTVNVRVAAAGTAQKTLEIQAANTATVVFTATSSWQGWITESASISLDAGVQTIRLYATSTGFNVNWIEFSTNEEPVLASISLTPQNITINEGATQQFIATGSDQFGNAIAFTPTWTGTNSNGLFTETTPATYTVTALSGSISASTNITVNPVLVPVLTSINLTPLNTSIDEGAVQQFTASGIDQFGNSIDFTPVWTGTDANGLFTETNPGTYTVSVSSGSIVASTDITVEPSVQTCTKYEAENWANMSGVQTEGTADVGGGLNVGWINPNDWIDINVYVSVAGNHTLKLRAATPNGPDVCQVQIDNEVAGQINIANTGSWQTWDTFETTINISSEGNHVIRLLALTDGFNMNWIELCGQGTSNTAPIASLVADPQTGTVPLVVTFDASASTDADGDGLTHAWEFGDGSSATGAIVQHTYTVEGNYVAVVTVNDGSLNASANTTISVAPAQTECLVAAANGDFSVEVSSDPNNPTLTFIPSTAGTGDNLLLLYYGTNPNGPYPGFMPTPNVPFEINASAGETVYFYYTYSLAGGGENNSSANKNSFVVGQCQTTLKNAEMATSIVSDLSNVSIYPNPVKHELTVDFNSELVKEIQLIDMAGNKLLTHNARNEGSLYKLSMNKYESGVYMLLLISHNSVKAFRVIKD